MQLLSKVLIFFIIFFSVTLLWHQNSYAGCDWGDTCGIGGHYEDCTISCADGDWSCSKCCGGGGDPKCNENGGGCHVDCAGVPPEPRPPVCNSLTLSGPPLSNPDLTISPNIQASWVKSGGSPSGQKFSWGAQSSGFPSKDPVGGNWGSYGNPPKNINLARDGSITQGWYEVKMELNNGDGSTQCVDRILYDHPPQIDEVIPDPHNTFPGVSGRYGRWSGTFDDGDNNPNFKENQDYNAIEYGIKVTDPDGFNDIKAINFGVGPKTGTIPQDIWTNPTQYCNVDDGLESVLMNNGLGVTFNFNSDGTYRNFNTLCGANAATRFSIDTGVQVVRVNANTAWLYFSVTYNNAMMQGMLDVWAKAMDKYGVWSGPDGIDKYQKFGAWGVDTQAPVKGVFNQKQPLTAKSVRVWWDGEDTGAGVAFIYKGCKKDGVEQYGVDVTGDSECLGLRGNWSNTNLAALPGNVEQYPSDVTGINYRGENVNYIEAIYTNPDLVGGEDYDFMDWVTDGANNMYRYDSDNRNIGQKWLQAIQGDVFANSFSISMYTPPDSLDRVGYYQLPIGYSTVMTKVSSTDPIPQAFKSVNTTLPTTNKTVAGWKGNLPYEFNNGIPYLYNTDTSGNALYEILREEAISKGKRMVLCGPAENPCTDPNNRDERAEKLQNRWITESGPYLIEVAGNTNIQGILSNQWYVPRADGQKHNVIFLVEGRGDSVKDLGIIASLDPNINLIIIAKNTNIILRNVGNENEVQKEHAFETDFLTNPEAVQYCRDNLCYNLSVSGKFSGTDWGNSFKDKDTYIRYERNNDDFGYNIVDPGLDVFGMFIISNQKVTIMNEEADYDGKLSRCIANPSTPECVGFSWDGDFERMEMRGGIVANQIEFGRNLVALDNSWMPAEKFIYGAQYINTFVEATKGIRKPDEQFGSWEEVGFDF